LNSLWVLPLRLPRQLGITFALADGVANERRTLQRRRTDRRQKPSDTIDVSRLEFENLSTQVAANVQTLRRIEHELRHLRGLIEHSESERKKTS
jgi:hypothetical protein